jgi:2-oxoisovalerate dehydrogenase E1 component
MPDNQDMNGVGQQAGANVATEQKQVQSQGEAQPFDPIDCFRQMLMARTINDILKTQGKFSERGRLYFSAPPKDGKGKEIAALAELRQVPGGYYTVPMRLARRIRIGSGYLTGAVVTWGTMVLEAAIAAANVVAQYGVAFDIVDLRTLVPFDEETISDAVKEANRVVVVTEEPGYTSFGRHVHSWILQHHFYEMDLPTAYICGKGAVPSVPYNSPEEMAFYPTSKDIEDVLIEFATA